MNSPTGNEMFKPNKAAISL